MENQEKETVILNGQEVSKQELQEAQQSCSKNERIKEVAPGEYRKQERMHG